MSIRFSLHAQIEKWRMAAPLRICGYTFTAAEVIVVSVSDGTFIGRGEAAGVFYRGDLPPKMIAQIELVRPRVESGITREELRELLPPGGARNAIDCALWDLESQQTGRPVWELAGLARPKPLLTTYTLGAGSPQAMARGATTGKFGEARALKLKLLADGLDAERVREVRAARPDIWIGVDANQGLSPRSFAELLPSLIDSGVQLIEQPFQAEADFQIDAIDSPIPLAADESVQSLPDIAALAGRFNVVNIKLDKCGGLTEAFMMVREGQRLGLRIMVGNMGGTSLAMAPAILVGQQCDIVDLDGPLFLQSDREPPVVYEEGKILPSAGPWGLMSAPRE
jgi:L-Ala-D/L-Glu epimerase